MPLADRRTAVSVVPRVSVTIPAYNSAKHLAKTLDSLFAQTHSNLEIIVVDDGSTDHTVDVLRPYMDRIVYHHQANAGLPAARNKGFELATGEFVAWMDADDICEPERVAVQCAFLSVNDDTAAIGSEFSAMDEQDVIFDAAHSSTYYSEFARHGLEGLFSSRETFDGEGVPWSPRLSRAYAIHRGRLWRRLVFGNFMHPPTMMMRRTAVEGAGRLRDGITSAEDWEYITRLARSGEIAFVDAPLLRYRRHPGQMSLRKAAVSTLSRITLLEETCRRYAHELAGLEAELERQLVDFHQDAAYMFADIDPKLALRHLVRAVRLRPAETRFLFHLARIAFPKRGLALMRKIRGIPAG